MKPISSFQKRNKNKKKNIQQNKSENKIQDLNADKTVYIHN